MRRFLPACISLILLLVLVSPGQAQLGGLKKKVADRVTGKKDTVAVAGGTSKLKCDKSSRVIASDVVDGYLKALAARDAEIRKMAGEPGKIGQFYAAYQKRKEVARRKEQFDLRLGADWEREKTLFGKYIKGDQAAMQQHQALLDSLDASKIEMPELEWDAQQQRNRRLDSVMIRASGLSDCDWIAGDGVAERLPRLVNVLVNDPEGKDLQGAGTPQEAAAVKARLSELAAGLGYNRASQPTEAQKAHIKAEDEKLAQSGMMTGDPYTDCATKTNQEWGKKHQAELEKASKDKDMNALMKLSMLQAQEVAKACKQYSKDNDDD
jgi:hypothetical protein